jgi:hypothetical protein
MSFSFPFFSHVENKAELKGDREVSKPTDVKRSIPAHGFTRHGKAHIRHAPQERGEGDIPFQPSKGCSQTDMHSLAKGHVTGNVAYNLQVFRVCEGALIMIG